MKKRRIDYLKQIHRYLKEESTRLDLVGIAEYIQELRDKVEQFERVEAIRMWQSVMEDLRKGAKNDD